MSSGVEPVSRTSRGRQYGAGCAALGLLSWSWVVVAQQPSTRPVTIGREVSVPTHLQDEQEFSISLAALLAHGERIFNANWTIEEGGGRPLTKGTGRPLADTRDPLRGVRAFNRISAPDANSCAGCHNAPYGIAGGGGDIVANVFVLGQRFDFMTFDGGDTLPTRGTVDEGGAVTSLQSAADSRATTGMFGAGYLEMLARQLTEELQQVRGGIRLGETKELVAKGIHFGKLTLNQQGLWDTTKVEGLGRLSLLSTDSHNPPSLVIRPWHQASNVVSLREFSNTAFNQHHGIQSTERFGVDTDPDGDGVKNELTRADVTAATVWQAALPVPGRVIPRNPEIERAVLLGERVFDRIGCASCHVPKLPLDKQGWVFVEPSPFNPPGNLRTGEVPDVKVDLSSDTLPAPRVKPDAAGNVTVEAYTDFKLHDICGVGDREPLDQNQAQWSRKLMEGNCRFLTKRLWGAANEPPFFHHGLFTTLRQSILGHSGEAAASRHAFEAQSKAEQDGLIEFLKTLQVLPPGTKDRIVDETFHARSWPPAGSPPGTADASDLGKELAVPRHLRDGDDSPLAQLIEYGKQLFSANWTEQDGGGRPLNKGTGRPLSTPSNPLTGSRAFNRISGPDANSCQGCHNAPFAIAGGAGDIVTNAFEMAHRFDFVTFDRRNTTVTGGSLDEQHQLASLVTVGNSRSTPGLFGAGYLEMLAREMTDDLRRIRDSIAPGQAKALASKGVSFGTLARRRDGAWVTRAVEGLPPQSLVTSASAPAPSLIIRPWQQSASAVSLRELTNTSFNQHLGMQSTERFGLGTDPDGDGVINELTRMDVSAVTIFEATLPVPGRVIPNDAEVERAVMAGEHAFDRIGCTTCHVPTLRLNRQGWIYSEPNPYNPSGNLRRGHARTIEVDLTDATLPQPRLAPSQNASGVLSVPAYTDFKLHDITNATDAIEALDINQSPASPRFASGNRKFLTRRLWDVASRPSYFHHGLFTTIRQAVLAHAGEALGQRRGYESLSTYEQSALIEFLKTLQVLPPATRALVVDEHYQPKSWPPIRQTNHE
jgi:CxxC motif-containing protein (DUF1111 family)